MLETAPAISDTVANDSASPATALGSVLNVNPAADMLEGWIAAHLGLTGLAADFLTAAIVLATFLVLSEIAKHFVTDVAPHLVSKTETTLDDELLKAVKSPIRLVIVVAGIYLACKSLNGLSPEVIDALDKVAGVALILVGAYLLSNLIGAIIQWYINDIAPKTGSDLDDHLMPFLKKFLIAAVYVVALVMAIGLFQPITPLVAGLGVAGIAVALAAKEALSNLFGAFAILTDRPYKVGDRLVLDGIGSGDVVDIGLRSTRVRTPDNRIVVLPNERLASSRIVNLSQPDTRIWLDLPIGIGYGADTDRACALLEGIAHETPHVSGDPKPRAHVSELGDFAITITLHVYIDSYKNDLIVPDTIYRNALAAFKKEGIGIPYPTVTVLPRQK